VGAADHGLARQDAVAAPENPPHEADWSSLVTAVSVSCGHHAVHYGNDDEKSL
jgi:hypothetical protein